MVLTLKVMMMMVKMMNENKIDGGEVDSDGGQDEGDDGDDDGGGDDAVDDDVVDDVGDGDGVGDLGFDLDHVLDYTHHEQSCYVDVVVDFDVGADAETYRNNVQ